jgi:hypothetical protein
MPAAKIMNEILAIELPIFFGGASVVLRCSMMASDGLSIDSYIDSTI